MAVPVRVLDVVGSQQAAQGPAHLGRVEDVPELRGMGQQVVAEVGSQLEHAVELDGDRLVHLRGHGGQVDPDVAVGDVAAHLLVVEQEGLGAG